MERLTSGSHILSFSLLCFMLLPGKLSCSLYPALNAPAVSPFWPHEWAFVALDIFGDLCLHAKGRKEASQTNVPLVPYPCYIVPCRPDRYAVPRHHDSYTASNACSSRPD